MSGRRLKQVAVVVTLVLASLATSHELIYVHAHGVGAAYVRAMQEGGHDRYWTSFVLTVAGVTLVLAVVAVCQIRRLHGQASLVRAGRLRVKDRGLGQLGRLTSRLWLLIATGSTFAFIVQENAETITAGRPMPGLTVVSGEHALSLPILAVVSLLVAFVAALARWGRQVLLARLRRSMAPQRRGAARSRRPALTMQPTSPVRVHAHGLRAPPPFLPSFA